PAMATIGGVSLVGGVRQAMFRTPTETITLTEGAQLGERRITRIGAEGVELREPTGQLRMVAIGGRVPVDRTDRPTRRSSSPRLSRRPSTRPTSRSPPDRVAAGP